MHPDDSWNSGDHYELYVGRWSRRVAPEFLAWLDLPPSLRWLEVGCCGTGALTRSLTVIVVAAVAIVSVPAAIVAIVIMISIAATIMSVISVPVAKRHDSAAAEHCDQHTDGQNKLHRRILLVK
jgi:hypothetical protein